MITLAILAVLALIAGIIAFLICDDLVRLLVQSESEQLNVEALLKLRHELVPGLMDVVRDYDVN
jgi:hypothetical protein